METRKGIVGKLYGINYKYALKVGTHGDDAWCADCGKKVSQINPEHKCKKK